MALGAISQERRDGPLTEQVRDRLQVVRRTRHWTLKELGAAFGLSGPFMSNLLRDPLPANIRSSRMPAFMHRLAELEAEDRGEPPVQGLFDKQPSPAAEQDSGEGWLEAMVREAHRRGFEIVVRPLKKD